MTALLSAHGLTVAAGGRTLVRGLTWGVQAGECWAVLGRNGAGKSSLLHTLAGLRSPTAGEVRLGQEALGRLPRRLVAQRLGVLLQQEEHLFPATVWETVMTGRHPHLDPWGDETERDEALVRAALAAVGLQGQARLGLASLSGGERRRVEAAALLAQDPLLWLLDEPVNHLDPGHQVELLQQVQERAMAKGGAMVVVLHDLHLVERFCGQVLMLLAEGQTEAGGLELLQEVQLGRLYGHPMRRANCWVP